MSIIAYKCYVWPTLFYGAQTWTITQFMLSIMYAFEIWIYRRMLKIPWTDNITNEVVLKRIGNCKEIVQQRKTRTLQYLGHIIIYNTSQLQLTYGNVKGKRVSGRSRTTWIHGPEKTSREPSITS